MGVNVMSGVATKLAVTESTMETETGILQTGNKRVSGVDFVGDGFFAFFSSKDKNSNVRITDGKTQPEQIFENMSSIPQTMAVTPESIFASSRSGELWMRDIATGKESHLETTYGNIRAFDVSHYPCIGAAASASVLLIDLSDISKPNMQEINHGDERRSISDVRIEDNVQSILVAANSAFSNESRENSVTVWQVDKRSRDTSIVFDSRDMAKMTSMAFVEDYLVLGSYIGTLEIVRIKNTNKPDYVFDLPHKGHAIDDALRINPITQILSIAGNDETHIITASGDGGIKLFELGDNDSPESLLKEMAHLDHGSRVTRLFHIPTDETSKGMGVLLSVGPSSLKIWDIDNRMLLNELQASDDTVITASALSKPGVNGKRQLIVGDDKGEIYTFKIDSSGSIVGH